MIADKPSPNHLPVLDIIRGGATLAVYGVHSYGAAFGMVHLPWRGWLPDASGQAWLPLIVFPLTYGLYGVAIFFAISGFCIHLSHRRAVGATWSSFALRRFFRLYPAYLVGCLVFFFLPLTLMFLTNARMANTWQLVSHLLLIHNFWPTTFQSLNPSFWSLAVEAQLYVIYPLLLVLASRVGWTAALACASVTELSIRGGLSWDRLQGKEVIPFWIAESPFAYWGSWAIGAYCAECYMTGTKNTIGSLPLRLLLPMCVLFPLVKPLTPFAFPIFALTTAVVMERFVQGRWTLPVAGPAGRVYEHMAFVGLVSYSLYLFHQPFLGIAAAAIRRFGGPEQDAARAAGLAVCGAAYPLLLGVAYLSFRWLEEPFLRVGKRVIAGSRKPVAES